MRFLLPAPLALTTALFACATPSRTSDISTSGWMDIPATFQGDRVFLEFSAPKGRLAFFSDSGGGTVPFTYRDSLDKVDLTYEGAGSEEDRKNGFVGFTDVPGLGRTRVFASDLPPDSEVGFIRSFVRDGFVGATYFGRETWQWDYVARTLKSAHSAKPPEGPGTVEVSFLEKNGERPTNQPRMNVEIDGESLPVLFDTGATSWYTPKAQKITGAAEFPASSFIRERVYRRWKSRHPEWKVIPKGERFSHGQDLIEVPEISIGGVKAGPAWFAVRPDSVYDRYGPEFLGGDVDGALGGNVFQSFRITADYQSKRFRFESSGG